jgi:hypothetical protein
VHSNAIVGNTRVLCEEGLEFDFLAKLDRSFLQCKARRNRVFVPAVRGTRNDCSGTGQRDNRTRVRAILKMPWKHDGE